MSEQFLTQFDQFIQSYIDQSNDDNRGLLTLYHEEWPSPCIIRQTDSLPTNSDEVYWEPVRKEPMTSFNNIAEALEIHIPAEFSLLMGRYFSLDLNAKTSRGNLTILQAWNEHDFERLQKNLVAHVLMKRKLKQEDTLFFAVTDEEDYIISILPDTGEVVLEHVGKPPQELLSNNLVEFFQLLEPVPSFVTL
ncbi:SecY-interacting protein [Agaribacter flavus]|uniref:Protein Syd n=1 Tax=Agaribacter flavus TaxID=1902781 RepID=A0ABV7FNP1_9ALTE